MPYPYQKYNPRVWELIAVRIGQRFVRDVCRSVIDQLGTVALAAWKDTRRCNDGRANNDGDNSAPFGHTFYWEKQYLLRERFRPLFHFSMRHCQRRTQSRECYDRRRYASAIARLRSLSPHLPDLISGWLRSVNIPHFRQKPTKPRVRCEYNGNRSAHRGLTDGGTHEFRVKRRWCR